MTRAKGISARGIEKHEWVDSNRRGGRQTTRPAPNQHKDQHGASAPPAKKARVDDGPTSVLSGIVDEQELYQDDDDLRSNDVPKAKSVVCGT